MPAILPYFWNIFSTSVLTTWKVLRLPTNTLQTRTIETAPHGYHLTCCSQPGGPGCSSDYQLWSSTWWAQLEWWLILQQKLNAPRSRLYKDSWETIMQPLVINNLHKQDLNSQKQATNWWLEAAAVGSSFLLLQGRRTAGWKQCLRRCSFLFIIYYLPFFPQCLHWLWQFNWEGEGQDDSKSTEIKYLQLFKINSFNSLSWRGL